MVTTNRFDLLRLAADEVLVPRAVADEVGRWGDEDAAVRALGATPWLKIIETPPVPPSVAAWNLGAGESAVLSYALAHPGVQAIVDDLAGRRCAAVQHINVRGCVGLVLVAKQRGLISLAQPVVEALREAGLYLSDDVIRELGRRRQEMQRIGPETHALREKRVGGGSVRRVPKAGRNDPCPCGSGRKYKKCCLATG